MHGFTFETAPAILFGAGRVREIGTIAAARGAKRALVITDKGLVAARLVDPAIGALVRAGIEATVFDEVVSDPPESTVLDALGEARDAEADCIIGFGGGSSWMLPSSSPCWRPGRMCWIASTASGWRRGRACR